MATRSHIAPEEKKCQTFKIRTYQAMQYLQDKIDVLVNVMNQKGASIPPMKIDLYSNYFSDKFIPFVIILDPTAAEFYAGPNVDEVEEDGEEIFQPSMKDFENGERPAELKHEFSELFKTLRYDKDRLELFDNCRYREHLRINKRDVVNIKYFSTPRFFTSTSSDGTSMVKIVMLIDPIALFHDMLTENDNKKFTLEVWIEKKVNDCEYRYRADKYRDDYNNRRRHGQKKEMRDNIASVMNRRANKKNNK